MNDHSSPQPTQNFEIPNIFIIFAQNYVHMSNKKWYQKLLQALIENGNAARDAKIGAIGAGQVRQLYKEGEDEKAKQLANDYLKANAAGIATGIGGMGTLSSISKIGVAPTIVTEAAGAVGGTVGAKAGEFAGQKIDNKFGTNVTPWLTVAGSLLGGVGGGIAGYKGVVKGAKYAVDNGIRGYSDFKPAIQEQILPTTQITQEPLLNVGWAPKQTIDVRRAGDLTEMYYPGRWDVVEEGANPFGVWLQGKFGIPRTDITNPGKGAKAKRARELFTERPQYSGQVTLDKPMQTVGEVSNRSVLSYDAERMGADGIIYNDVYDNGYNNNQVIFSFKRPELNEDLIEVPKYAFVHSSTPLDEIKLAVSNTKGVKFAEDVMKGAKIARKTQQIFPEKLHDYTSEISDVLKAGQMPNPGIQSWFRSRGIPGRQFLGEGYENAVFTNGDNSVLKFSLGREVQRRNGRIHKTPISYGSLDEMIAGSTIRLNEANKYWFAEPTSLVGYYTRDGLNGKMYFPVYQQTRMARGLPEVSYWDIQDNLSPGVINVPGAQKALRVGVGHTTNAFERAAERANLKAMGSDYAQFKYITDGIKDNAILLENGLPIPKDVHSGNFMFGTDGVLRGTDLLKTGGQLPNFQQGGIFPYYLKHFNYNGQYSRRNIL